MLRLAVLAGGVSLLAVSGTGEAHAQYGYGYGQGYGSLPVQNVQCQRQKSSDGAAGAVLGALTGALIGGAIGNNVDNDRYVTEYGRRGRSVTYRERRSNSGQVAVGATLGALVGGLAGNDIGRSTGPDCQVAYSAPGYASVPRGSIPQTTQGLYGGPEVMRGAPAASPPYSRSPRQYPTSSYPSYPAQQPAYGGAPPSYPPRPAPQPGYQAQGGNDPNCRVIHRETPMPDGQVFRDPVTVCRNERTGQWQIQDGWDDELGGY